MPVKILTEAGWVVRLLGRTGFITQRKRKNGTTHTRYRIPNQYGKPEWEPGEEAVQKIDPDGTTTNIR